MQAATLAWSDIHRHTATSCHTGGNLRVEAPIDRQPYRLSQLTLGSVAKHAMLREALGFFVWRRISPVFPRVMQPVCAPSRPSISPLICPRSQNRAPVQIGMGHGSHSQPPCKPVPLHQSARSLTHTDDELYTQVSTHEHPRITPTHTLSHARTATCAG